MPAVEVFVYFDPMVATDIADDVNSVTIRRGNTSQIFPTVNAGTCTIQINNDGSATLGARTYDPEYASSTFVGDILPGRAVVVTVGGETVFTGKVEDWGYVYEPSGRSVAVLTAVDGLAVLGRQELDEFTTTNGQLPGELIEEILDRDEVQWSALFRSVDEGLNILGSTDVAFAQNVLAFLNTVSNSDIGGTLYVSRLGYLVFKDRHYAINGAAAPEAIFSDDGTGGDIAYESIQTDYGSEQLFNRNTVQSSIAGSATVLSVSSQNDYGIRSNTSPTTLIQGADAVLDAAGYLASVYEEPRYRVTQLAFELAKLSGTDQDNVTTLDLSSVVTVQFTPNGTGSAITSSPIITGLAYDIAPASCYVTIDLGVGIVQTGNFWTVEDATYGTLDGGGTLSYPVAF
jgi:hypothetical protein